MLPSQDELRSYFDYNSDKGKFLLRPREVGFKNKNYAYVSINGVTFLEHRLVWVYHNGPIPDDMVIDHINGIYDDNRIENLRMITQSENMRNQKLHRDSRSGATGVVWHPRDRLWNAQITINKRKISLGYYKNFDEAVAARKRADKLYGFHPNHGRVLQ